MKGSIDKKGLFISNDEDSKLGNSSYVKGKSKAGTTADLILNKQDILDSIGFIHGIFPIPCINKVCDISLPDSAVPFSKALNSNNKNIMVVFYEPDVNFARILHNPKRYVEPLKKFSCVVGPDFSQKIGMNSFICFCNSWWNKALTAYYQSQGVVMVPNVTWSIPSSYN